MQRLPRAVSLVLMAGLALSAAACGDDGSSDDTTAPAGTEAVDTSPSNTAAPDTTEPDRTVPDDSEPDDTEPESSDPGPTTTSVTTSTAPATSTTAPVPVTGWEASDFVPGAAAQGYSGNWAGDAGPSPAAPTGTNPPADGWYVASLREPWDPARPDTLPVRIQRLERCSVLPGGCDNMDDPSEMNIDPTWQLDLDLPLDATTDVVVGGFKCWEAPEQKQGTGVELADLFTAYTTDYAAAIEPRLSDDGMTNWELALDVAAAPTGGFVGEEAMCPGEEAVAGPLRYAHDDAPVLLLQSVTDWDGGPLGATDLVRLGGVQYTGGVPVFYFYAGFYS